MMNQWVTIVPPVLLGEGELRTKRPSRWRRVLYQYSMCVVSPVSLPEPRKKAAHDVIL